MAAFGPVAFSATDSGYRAFSGSGAMPVRPQASGGSTTKVWDVRLAPLRRGIGNQKDVWTDSVAVNEGAPLSAGISGTGGGTMAVASAGDAVASSDADR